MMVAKMEIKLKLRRFVVVACGVIGAVIWLVLNPESYEEAFIPVANTGAESGIVDENGTWQELGDVDESAPLASGVLERLEVKGRAPKTGYKREEFYNDWPSVEGCSLRQRIIKREFGDSAVLDGCNVIAGEYDEPYTGQHLVFTERSQISSGVQIDHVVALSDAWQKGAQYMEYEVRHAMATDPLNLLAVDASANSKKSDGDAATWLPSNKRFRCQYVARQVSVKYKYGLWITSAEKEAISGVLNSCPEQRSIGVTLE